MVTKKYLDSMLTELEGRASVSIHALNGDLNILSRRITNGFNYITTIMQEHEARFHPRATPKKGKK
jgi:hypothetical protein